MKLFFQNEIFKKGENVTVRRGFRWHRKQASNVQILSTTTKRFRNITPKDIKNEHDPICRTYKGLLKTMKKIYKGFSANENVTIVRFKN